MSSATDTTGTWAALFDQGDNLAAHSSRGIEFVDRYGSFIKDRVRIEQDYAKGLRTLVDRYTPKGKPRNDEIEFSYVKAFNGVLNELGCVAGQHEVVAESLREKVLARIGESVRDLKLQRKGYQDELKRLDEQLKVRMDDLAKSHREYCKAWREAEDADQKYHKAEENLTLSRLDVQKAKDHAYKKGVDADRKKQEYAAVVEQANQAQRAHYGKLLPDTLEAMRKKDEQRIEEYRTYIQEMASIETGVLSLLQRCYEGMAEHAAKISPGSDTASVAKRLESGYLPPEDIQMEDLGRANGNSETGSGAGEVAPNGGMNGAKHSAGTLGRGKGLLRNLLPKHYAAPSGPGIDGDGDDLPPQQRVNRLEMRLQALESDLSTKSSEREGLVKMQKLYEKNPKMGDLAAVQGRLASDAEDIERMKKEAERLQAMLKTARSKLNVPINQKFASRPAPIPASTSPVPPDASAGRQPNGAPDSAAVVPPPSQPTNNLRGVNPARGPVLSAATAANNNNVVNGSNEQHYNEADEVDGDVSVVIGIAKALYNFDGSSDNTIEIKEGDEVQVTEADDGDGWTRIRRVETGDEGFVPTSYVEVMLYPET